MAQNEALILQISADVRRLEKAMNQARGTTNRQLSFIEQRFDRMNSHVRRSGDQMARDLRTSIAAIGIGAAVSQVTDYADAWTQATNKLAAAGVEQDRLAGTMREIVALSKETGSSFEATADLYSKIQRNAASLGLTQAEVLKITEQVNKAFVAGGAAAGEQASGILQLGQALGSGVLQGDELKALRENAPLLAQAIADEFGTTIAGLKELGAQGELESKRVAKAILEATSIQDQFARTTRTVAQAMENLRTEFTRYIAESRVAQTVVQALGGFIIFATDNLDAFADAAIVAASVIGGALAAGAIVRFIGALGTMIQTARAATTAMQALRIATTFFSGPVGAVILGIGAAVGALALNTFDAGTAMERATTAMEGLQSAEQEIATATEALAAAQARLTKAIEANSVAAQTAAIAEIEANRKIIESNKQLAISRRVTLNEAKAQREREFRAPIKLNDRDREGISFPILGLLGDETLPLDQLVKEMQRTFERSGMNSSLESIRSEIARRSQQGPLDEQFRSFFWILSRYDQYQADLKSIETQLKDITTLEQGGSVTLPFPTGPEAKAGTRAVAGYRTEVEKLRDALADLRKGREDDEALFSSGVMSVDSLSVSTDQTDPAAIQKLDEAQQQLRDLMEGVDQRTAERSREAVQALLNYATAADDVAGAIGKIPSIADILTDADEGLVRAELGKMANAAADAIATGVDQIEVEFVSTITAIERAREAAIAAGITDLARFDRAVSEAFDKLDTDLEARIEAPFPDDLEALVDGLSTSDLPDFVDEFAELREGMREAVKNGLEEGIRTDNWGEALRSVLAAAISGALDDTLKTIADVLTDVLTGQGGSNNFLASIVSTFGGARASGGPVRGGRSYLVGENGPEIVRMGGDGQVLNASMTRSLMAGGSGPTIITTVNLSGGDDRLRAEFHRALNQRDARIMAAVPGAVNATLTDNRMQRRRP